MTTATAPRVATKPPAGPGARVTAYARAVVARKIVAGKPVRQACKRHIEDLKHGAERGLRFDGAAAQHAIDFFETVLCLSEGDFANQPFILQPFEAFIVGSLFGWKGTDGYRRFRTAYVEMGKGNGKTPMGAGVELYCLVADREEGAQIYSAATTYEQASIAFRDAKNMATASPSLSELLDITEYNLAFIETRSFLRPISAERRGLDGKRPHMALIDEVHEHPDATVVDKLRAGTKNRRQALIFEITNSGYNRQSVCWNHHAYSLQVVAGIIENDAWFAYVCQLDEGDDFFNDERCWPKANPGLDTILPRKYLREQIAEAQGMPSKQNIVMRLNGCVWTEQQTLWMPMAAWDKCRASYSAEDMRARPCYGGLDLARVRDLSAFVKVFPPRDESEKWRVLARFWVPEDDITERSRRDRVPYDVWAREGLIETTPGNTTDFAFIEQAILEDAGVYDLREVPFDRTFAGEIVTNLMNENVTMAEFGQGFLSMASPTAELLRLVLAGQLEHDGNPVLRWMASNVVVKQDAAGNWKPDKEHSNEKIDGIVALIMGLGRATVRDEDGGGISVYIPQ